MREPRRDHYIAPATGEDSRAALEAAIENLGKLRGLEWVGDAAVTLHLLASLITEARSRLPAPSPTPGTRTAPGDRSLTSLVSPGPAPGSVTPAARSWKGPPSRRTDY